MNRTSRQTAVVWAAVIALGLLTGACGDNSARSRLLSTAGSIRNELHLNRPTAVSGGPAAGNSETGVHLQVAWGIPVTSEPAPR